MCGEFSGRQRGYALKLKPFKNTAVYDLRMMQGHQKFSYVVSSSLNTNIYQIR